MKMKELIKQDALSQKNKKKKFKIFIDLVVLC